jgi:hypothetical protein
MRRALYTITGQQTKRLRYGRVLCPGMAQGAHTKGERAALASNIYTARQFRAPAGSHKRTPHYVTPSASSQVSNNQLFLEACLPLNPRPLRTLR